MNFFNIKINQVAVLGLLSMLLILASKPVQAETFVAVCDRSEYVVDEILVRTGKSACADVTADDLASITWMNLDGELDLSLATGDFSGMNGLTSLNLEDSDMIILPPRIFGGLSSLRTLRLADNELTSLPADLFNETSALYEIYLDDNELSSLPAGVFNALGSLDLLWLNGNDITSLPSGIFDNVTNLTSLSLGSNKLTSLPSGIFDKLDNQPSISLDNNELTELPTGLFDEITLGWSLGISSNSLTSLPSGLLDDQTELVELEITDNQLTTLPSGIFDDLSSLVTLRIHNNELTTIPNDLFDNTVSLQSLNMRNTGLTTLPVGLLDNMPSLQVLYFNQNEIEAIPTGFFENSPMLSTVSLSNNEITELPIGLFDKLTSLRTLNLQFNALSALPAGIFNGLSSLESLFLNNNELTTFYPQFFSNLTSLYSFTLDNNPLSALPAGFFDNATVVGDLDIEFIGFSVNNLPIDLSVNLTYPQKVLQSGEANFTITVVQGAPQDLTYVLSATNGEIQLNGEDISSVTIAAGTSVSEVLTFLLDDDEISGEIIITTSETKSGLAFKGGKKSAELFRLDSIQQEDGFMIGSPFTLTLPNTSGHIGAVSFNVTGLGTGMLFNSSTRTLSGAVDSVSELDLTYTATDIDGEVLQTDFVLGFYKNYLPLCYRSAKVQTEILSHLTDTSCSTVTETTVNAIDDDLIQIGASVLKSGDFSGLDGVTTISLGSGSVTEVPAGLFDGLSGLEHLSISFNDIKELPSGLFDDLVNLENLFFSENKLTTLPEGILDNLANLDRLQMIDNELTELKQGLFDNVTGITNLQLRDNDLKELPPGIFTGLTQLSTFNIYSQANDLPIELNVSLPRDNLPTSGGMNVTIQAIQGVPEDIIYTLTTVDGSFYLPEDKVNKVTEVALTGGTDLFPTLYFQLDAGKVSGSFDISTDDTTSGLEYLSHTQNLELYRFESPVENQGVIIDTALNYTMPAVLGGIGDVNYTMTGLGSELFFDEDTRILSGDLSTAEIYNLSYTANDTDGNVLVSDFTAGVYANILPLCYRTPLVRSKILTLSGESNCANVDNDDLAGITTGTLNLELSSLTTLKVGDLSGLTGLTKLKLNTNVFAELPKRVFEGLSALTELYLYDNELLSLDNGVFDDLTALTRLDLQYNNLTALPEGIFDNLTELETLNLRTNQIAELSEGVFKNLTSIEDIELQENNLVSLPKNLFTGLTNLDSIDLSDNTASLAFDLAVNLSRQNIPTSRELVFDFTVAQGVPATVTYNLISNSGSFTLDGETITSVDLTAGISTVEDITFVLADDALAANFTVSSQSILEGATLLNATEQAALFYFETLPKQQGLIADTPISLTLPASSGGIDEVVYSVIGLKDGLSFDPDTRIIKGVPATPSSINLTYQVKDSDSNIEQSNFSVHVYESYLPVCYRSDAVKDLILDLRNEVNCNEVLENDLSAISSLTFTGESLSALKVGDFSGLPALLILNLDNNDLTELSERIFEDLDSLLFLKLQGNNLTGLPTEVFTDLTSLTELNISTNELSQLPENIFSGLTALTKLNLDSNFLAGLPSSAFGGLTSLTELYLNDNELLTLSSDIFTDLSSLTDLDLQLNNLTGLPEGIFDNLNDIESINLQNNNLASLPSGLFDGLTNLDSIDLSSNAVSLAFDLVLNLSRQNIPSSRELVFDFSVVQGAPEELTYNLTSDSGSFSLDGETVTSVNLTVGQSTVEDITFILANNATTAEFTVFSDYVLDGVSLLNASEQVGLFYFETLPEEQGVIADTPITFTLPAALGGINEVVYSVTGLIDGLSFDSESRIVTGTPATPSSIALTYQVVDSDGNIEQSDFNVHASESYLPVCYRTETIKDRILTLTSESDCSQVTEDDLAVISSLNFADESLTALKVGDFSGLAALEELDLDNNNLTELSERIFEDLSALLTLKLSDNSLSELPSEIFSDLTALTQLDVGNNALSQLAADVFNGLTALTQLNASNNVLSQLPGEIFSGLSGLNDADFSGNSNPLTLDLNLNLAAKFLPSSGVLNFTLTLLQSSPEPIAYDLTSDNATFKYNDLTVTSVSFVPGQSVLENLTVVLNDGTSSADMMVTTEDTIKGFALQNITQYAEINLNPYFTDVIENQTVVFGELLNLSLPSAIGGNGVLTFNLTETDSGFIYDSTDQTLTGIGSVLGVHNFTYQVTDIHNSSEQLDFSITVDADTQVVFDEDFANLSFITRRADQMSLALPGFTSGNAPFTYSLSHNVTGLQVDFDTQVILGTPTSAEGDYELNYTVTDSNGDVNSYVFTLTLESNPIPVFDEQAESNYLIEQGSLVSISLPNATLEDGTLSYSLAGLSVPEFAGLTHDAESNTLLGTASGLGLSAATLTAIDADNDTSELILHFNFVAASQPAFTDSIEAVVSDIDGQLINISIPVDVNSGNGALSIAIETTINGASSQGLPAGLTLSESDDSSFSIWGYPTEKGLYSVNLTLSDADNFQGEADESNSIISISVADSLVFESEIVNKLQTFTLEYEIEPIVLPAVQGGRGALSYVVSGLPTGVGFNSSSLTVSGAPEVEQNSSVLYSVTDEDGRSISAQFTVTVLPAIPDIEQPANIEDIVNQDGEIALSIPADADVYNYSLTLVLTDSDEALPAGLVFDETTAMISYDGIAPGNYSFTYVIQREGGPSVQYSFILNILDESILSFDSGAESYLIEQGSDIEISFGNASGNKPPFTYSFDTTLSGLEALVYNSTLNSVNGQITAIGVYNSTLTVSDPSDSTANKSVVFTVEEASVPSFTETFALIALDHSEELWSFVLPIDTNKGNGELVVEVIGLPDGFSFDHSNYTISGMVNQSFVADNITVTVSDSDNVEGADDESTFSFKLTVAESLSFEEELAIKAYTFNLLYDIEPIVLPATQGGRGNLSYEVSELPAGIVFNSSDLTLSGTPTQLFDATVIYSVRDEDGRIISTQFNLTVIKNAPVIEPPADLTFERGELINVTLPIPQDAANQTYFYHLSLKATANSLPKGLSFEENEARINGSIDVADTYTFVYRVSNSKLVNVEYEFNIKVTSTAFAGLSRSILTRQAIIIANQITSAVKTRKNQMGTKQVPYSNDGKKEAINIVFQVDDGGDKLKDLALSFWTDIRSTKANADLDINSEQLSWDGSTKSLQFGFDVGYKDGLYGVISSDTSANLVLSEGGNYKLNLQIDSPFVAYRLDNVKLWATFGSGNGDAKASFNGHSYTSDAKYSMSSLGANYQFDKGPAQVLLSFETTQAAIDIAGSASYDASKNQASQTKFSLDASYGIDLGEKGNLTPSFKFALRTDNLEGSDMDGYHSSSETGSEFGWAIAYDYKWIKASIGGSNFGIDNAKETYSESNNWYQISFSKGSEVGLGYSLGSKQGQDIDNRNQLFGITNLNTLNLQDGQEEAINFQQQVSYGWQIHDSILSVYSDYSWIDDSFAIGNFEPRQNFWQGFGTKLSSSKGNYNFSLSFNPNAQKTLLQGKIAIK